MILIGISTPICIMPIEFSRLTRFAWDDFSLLNRNSEYTDKDDGSKRVRVRFNLEGEHGNAFVFAEVSNNMSSGEFVYRTYFLILYI